nr:molybdopterin cofactor-binding domain-containing protein [Ruegeria arenilitoris]
MTTLSRRGFLKSAAAAGAVLAVGVHPNGAVAAGAEPAVMNPFLKLATNGRVTAIVKHAEIGQGAATGLTTLIAEELGVQMDQIDFEFAPSNPQLYNNLHLGTLQGTGGSTAIANSYVQYRTAGAAARDMLINAAASDWGVSAADLSIENGTIAGAGHVAPLGDYVVAASQLDAPAEPKLKDPSEFKLIGRSDLRRKDGAAKTNGSAKFAMDLHLDNQIFATVLRSPRMGGKLVDFDASGAEGIRGFIGAEALPAINSVAIYAENTWAAFQARNAIEVTWDDSEAETRSSDQIQSEMMALLDAKPTYDVTGDAGGATSKIDEATTVVEETFYFPLLAHAPMEPLNCIIEPGEDGGVILHDAAQGTTIVHNSLSQALGLPWEKIKINVTLAGGSFGRRTTSDSDYQVEAALAFAATDRTRPVKLVWSREDDITAGFYRPAVAHRVKVGLDAEGNVLGWDHRIAAQSLIKGTVFEDFVIKDGIDATSVEGVNDTHYMVPNLYVGLSDAPKTTTVLWWRSVGHTHTAYVMESMIDVVAKAAGRDPLEFRLELLEGGDKDQVRLARVLKLAAEKANWGQAAAGRSQGLAVHKSFGSYVAEVVEVSGTAENGIQVERVTCAVDCGLAVNPDVVKAQMEGGIGYGLGHAMRNEITLTDGVVDQSNFPDYEPLRIGDIAAIDVHIVPSAEAPSGVGEPGTPPSAPALANAIAANGPRVTALPMINNGVEFL